MPVSDRKRRLIGRLQRRKTRERERAFLAEGIRCVSEVLAAGYGLRFALVSPRLNELTGGAELRVALERDGVESIGVTDAEVRALGGTETPQGVLAVARQPDHDPDGLPGPRLLVADALGDPGNLGTLVRSAVGFGLDGLIALDGCVDPFNPKAVRASAGLVARLPILSMRWERAEALLGADGHRLLVSGAEGEPAATVDPTPPWALVVGNEGAGARDAVRAAAAGAVAITLRGGVDSLNAATAGSILMYALTHGSRRATDSVAPDPTPGGTDGIT